MFVLRFWRRHPQPVLRVPVVPPGVRVYAVGDVHGCLPLLDQLLGQIREDAERALSRGLRCELVFLGDVIDRGPDSRGVLDRLLGGLPPDLSARFVMGNHEAAMRSFLTNPAAGAGWLTFGGVETLASYGVRASVGIAGPQRLKALAASVAERLPAPHRHFLETMSRYVEIGDYAFVHAGVRPGQPLHRQHPEDLMEIREPFLSSALWHGRMIVHGHTVVEAPQRSPNRIGIDTGAYLSGHLTALVLQDEEQLFLQTNARTQ